MTLVTGLPRSGTSLVMQMLEAGGAQIFTDGVRQADRYNERGYYEHEKVLTDWDWLPDAKGKVVKVLLPRALQVPEEPERVIICRRDMGAILDSQDDMARKKLSQTNRRVLIRAYRKYLRQAHVRWPDALVLWYETVLNAPYVASNYIGNGLNWQRMAKVVRPELQHWR